MTESNATILIPDISGFTEFMTRTELSHGTRAINMLIDAIVNAVGDEYEVAEIEGDAVLMIKKGPVPSQKDILDICLKIFNGFHFQRKWMQDYKVCPCGACLAIEHLTLKFIVHHGALAELKVGRFIKQSGTEMIVAHRLLKNSIGNNEYLLLTEKLLQQAADSSEMTEMQWSSSFDEYSSIGQIDYRFALLNEARKNVPEPPAPQNNYRTDNTPFLKVPIGANNMEVYMSIMNIPERHTWMPGLRKVEQDMPVVYVGSTHCCTFDNYEAIVSPLTMQLIENGILYAESCRIEEMGLSLVHEYLFTSTGENSSIFATRFLNAEDEPVPAEISALLSSRMNEMADKLKEHCEKSLFV